MLNVMNIVSILQSPPRPNLSPMLPFPRIIQETEHFEMKVLSTHPRSNSLTHSLSVDSTPSLKPEGGHGEIPDPQNLDVDNFF